MADAKISALPAAAGVTADDLIPIVNDPAGTPATQKATAAQVRTYLEGALTLNASAITAGALAVARGGTALASYTVGDLLYADGATSLAKLADVATGNALISGGIGVAPAWGKVDLTAHVTGILPSANGGTGVNNAGTITNATNTTITGGGTLALAGFTLTVPATGTAALLATANTFTVSQTISTAGTVALAVTSTSNTGIAVTANAGGDAMRPTSSSTGIAIRASYTGAAAAAIQQIVVLNNNGSSGGTGVGVRLSFQGRTSTTQNVDQGDFASVWADGTHASRTARITGNVFDTATREWIRGEASGSAAMIGFLGAAAIARQTVAADATDLATAITLANDIKAKLSQAAGGFGLFT